MAAPHAVLLCKWPHGLPNIYDLGRVRLQYIFPISISIFNCKAKLSNHYCRRTHTHGVRKTLAHIQNTLGWTRNGLSLFSLCAVIRARQTKRARPKQKALKKKERKWAATIIGLKVLGETGWRISHLRGKSRGSRVPSTLNYDSGKRKESTWITNFFQLHIPALHSNELQEKVVPAIFNLTFHLTQENLPPRPKQ